jgi:hypothetical protein
MQGLGALPRLIHFLAQLDIPNQAITSLTAIKRQKEFVCSIYPIT